MTAEKFAVRLKRSGQGCKGYGVKVRVEARAEVQARVIGRSNGRIALRIEIGVTTQVNVSLKIVPTLQLGQGYTSS